MTYSTTNSSDRTVHQDVALAQPAVIQYTINVGDSCHCAAEFMIVVDDQEVDIKTVNFSKS